MSASLLLALNKQVWESVICTVQSVGHRGGGGGGGTVWRGPMPPLAMAALAVATVPLAVLVMRARCGIRLGAVHHAAAAAAGGRLRHGNGGAAARQRAAGAGGQRRRPWRWKYWRVPRSIPAWSPPSRRMSPGQSLGFVSRLLALDA